MKDLIGKNIVLEAANNMSWCLCIFFSVDIEGATRYKVETRKQEMTTDWCYLFESFYEYLPENFFNEYSNLADHAATRNIKEPIRPVLWKFVGDEILFYAPLTDSCQTLEHLRAFSQTILDYNKYLKEEQKINVKCKGTTWIAGFPVNNRIVLIPNREELNLSGRMVEPKLPLIDFIGSSMDCGFRLTKFASSCRLIVSSDLIWMVAGALERCSSATSFTFIKTKIKYEGKHKLKGVFGKKPYPVFGLDMSSSTSTIKNKWCITPNCNTKDIIKFCNKLSSRPDYSDFIKPFIQNDPSKLFGDVKPDFEARRQCIIDYKKMLPSDVPVESDTERVVRNRTDVVSNIRKIKSLKAE
jgi:hypothetical protein